MRSAFESQAQTLHSGSESSDKSTSSRVSSVIETENGRHLRIVGFPEVSVQATKNSASSCDLGEKLKRQGSLGQQIALDSFEKNRKSRLPLINTRSVCQQRATVHGSHYPIPAFQHLLSNTLPSESSMIHCANMVNNTTAVAIPQGYVYFFIYYLKVTSLKSAIDSFRSMSESTQHKL